jgi:transposase
VAYAVEAGDDLIAMQLQWWLDEAFGLARGLTELAASTLARKRRELEQDLDAILKAPATCDLAQALQARMRRARDQLLTFVAFPGQVDVTNNACERDLRPAVIQRKVTNGYRAMWATRGEADVRTVVATAALRTKATPFATLLATITA